METWDSSNIFISEWYDKSYRHRISFSWMYYWELGLYRDIFEFDYYGQSWFGWGRTIRVRGVI